MRNNIAASLITGAIIILVSALNANAQHGRRLVAEIPFEFYVKVTRLPAGKYEFFQADNNVNASPLVVRTLSSGKTSSAVAMTNPDISTSYGAGPVIVFNQYRGSNFLSAVHSSRAGVGLKIVQGRDESSLTKNLAKKKTITIRPVTPS